MKCVFQKAIPKVEGTCADADTEDDSMIYKEPTIDQATGEWILNTFDVRCIAIGAGILGCGGGGNPVRWQVSGFETTASWEGDTSGSSRQVRSDKSPTCETWRLEPTLETSSYLACMARAWHTTESVSKFYP